MTDYDPSTLYGAGYQRDAVDPKAMLAWKAIADVFAKHFEEDFSSWLDIGCGPGGLIYILAEHHRWSVLGLEGSREALGLLQVPIVQWDLRRPLNLAPHDIVSCFDVAEHIGNAEAVIHTCAENTGKILLFGAAPPGQDGLGHIDCRPHEFWTEGFKKAEGLTLDQPLTDTLRAALREAPGANHCWWVEKNLHAYQRR